MKTMKKLASLTLALLLTVALAAPALAAEEPAKGSITITETATSQTYHAYRLLDLKTFADTTPDTPEDGQYLYVVNTLWSEFFAEDNPGAAFVDINESPDYENETYVTWKTGASAVDLAAAAKTWLGTHTIAFTAEAESTEDGVATFTELELGYYLIDSTVGTTCFLDTTNPDVTIEEKNELPTVTKKIVSGTERVDEISASYGDTITFEVTVKVPASSTEPITVNDTMAAGLTYTGNLAVAGEGTVTEGTTSPLTFVLPADDANKAAGDVVFTYTATLNSNATTGTAGNTNSVNLTYNVDQITTTSTVTVYTYEFDLVKTRSDKTVLDGATFALYNTATDGAKITVKDNGDGTYSVDPDSDDDITAGNVVIKGLADDTYYLEELTAPDGYNRLANRAAVSSTVEVKEGDVVTGKDSNKATVTDGSYVDGGVQVINLTGAEMPSTGGIGTTIFYIVGGILVVGAAVILVAKKRVSGDEE